MTLAMVCVLPVPGGPCTTTPSEIIQQLDDADLLVVEGLGEVEVARLLAARAALRVIRCGHATE